MLDKKRKKIQKLQKLKIFYWNCVICIRYLGITRYYEWRKVKQGKVSIKEQYRDKLI